MVREVRTIEEMRACEAVQLEVWGFEDREIVPAAHLRAVHHAGGVVLGGFAQDRIVGFAYGFPARALHPHEEGVGLHSHMVAVRPAYQRSGVGRQLKWAQRAWCLEQGMGWITWTFDPIQAKNARLNFHHLGVRSYAYLVDFYGLLESALSGRQPTDRLLALWDLRDEGVARRAAAFERGVHTTALVDAAVPGRNWDGAAGRGDVGAGLVRDAVVTADPEELAAASGSLQGGSLQGEAGEGEADTGEADAGEAHAGARAGGGGQRWLVSEGIDGRPRRGPLEEGAPAAVVLRVAVPKDATALLRDDPETARTWRLAVRGAMVRALGNGYGVDGFEDGAYRLTPAAP